MVRRFMASCGVIPVSVDSLLRDRKYSVSLMNESGAAGNCTEEAYNHGIIHEIDRIIERSVPHKFPSGELAVKVYGS